MFSNSTERRQSLRWTSTTADSTTTNSPAFHRPNSRLSVVSRSSQSNRQSVSTVASRPAWNATTQVSSNNGNTGTMAGSVGSRRQILSVPSSRASTATELPTTNGNTGADFAYPRSQASIRASILRAVEEYRQQIDEQHHFAVLEQEVPFVSARTPLGQVEATANIQDGAAETANQTAERLDQRPTVPVVVAAPADMETSFHNSCPVCYEEMPEGQSRLLPCYHTICLSCVRRIVTGFVGSCPMCRQNFDGRLELLPENYALEQAMQAFRSELAQLCDDCAGYFRRQKSTTLHRCLQCSKTLCSTCVLSKHRDHVEYVTEQDKYLETEWQSSLARLSALENSARFQLLFGAVDQVSAIRDLMSSEHTNHEDMTDQFNCLQENIQKLKTKQLNELNTASDARALQEEVSGIELSFEELRQKLLLELTAKFQSALQRTRQLMTTIDALRLDE